MSTKDEARLAKKGHVTNLMTLARSGQSIVLAIDGSCIGSAYGSEYGWNAVTENKKDSESRC